METTPALADATHRSNARRVASQAHSALLLIALLILPSLGAVGCNGCNERIVNPESPEEAAELWATLLCDRRESMISYDINDIEAKQAVMRIRAQVVAGDINAEGDARLVGQLRDYLEEEVGREIFECTSEVTNVSDRDGGKKWVEFTVKYNRVVVAGESNFALREVVHRLGLEATQIDGAWLITVEPTAGPTEDELSLFIYTVGTQGPAPTRLVKPTPTPAPTSTP